ncbi:BLOC-1-related complex subunit 8 isoform X3 [Phyllopteryx taeniolatus]|uniref:BLOC-1-related complex subunit 8 isoform X3 n=1 Tax=Phyllopteryx taeniolatus TaxID=161469 RepID=UPI002AD24828|nr:BLOC-1-related complex subunit 8 isoform X3 [Phyllopteryx taeniolatus]
MEDQEMQLKVRRVSDKFTESMYVLANEPSVALYRLQEHVRRSLPELVQHKTDMQSWEEQSQGAIYSVEYACRFVGLLLSRICMQPPATSHQHEGADKHLSRTQSLCCCFACLIHLIFLMTVLCPRV